MCQDLFRGMYGSFAAGSFADEWDFLANMYGSFADVLTVLRRYKVLLRVVYTSQSNLKSNLCVPNMCV